MPALHFGAVLHTDFGTKSIDSDCHLDKHRMLLTHAGEYATARAASAAGTIMVWLPSFFEV